MLFRVLAVLALCSFLAGGSLLAWRARPTHAPLPAPTLRVAAAPAPGALAEELPWVNRDALPGFLRIEGQVVLGRPVEQVRVSDDGRRIAARTSEGRLWLVRREGTTLVRERAIEGVNVFALAPSGTLLATSDDNGDLRLWTLPAHGEPASRLVAHDAWVRSLRGERLRWVDRSERRFELDDAGAPRAVEREADRDDEVLGTPEERPSDLPTSWGFVKADARVAGLSLVGTGRGWVVLFDPAHDVLLTAARVQRGSIEALVSRGPRLFSAGDDGVLRLWHVDAQNAPSATPITTGSRNRACGTAPVSFAFSDDDTNRHVAAYQGAGGTCAFTPERPEGARVPEVVLPPFLPHGTVFKHPDEPRLLFYTDDGALESSVDLSHAMRSIDSIAVGVGGRYVLVRELLAMAVIDRTNPRAPTVRRVEGAPLDHIKASPSGAWFAAATNFTEGLRVWRPGHEDEVRTQPFNAGTLEFDAADSVLVFTRFEQASAWHLASDRVVTMEQPAGGRVLDVHASGDGTRALGHFDDGSMVLWETQTGRIVRHFSCPQSPEDDTVSYTELSPDGTLALAHTWDGVFTVCSTTTGAQLGRWIIPTEAHSTELVATYYTGNHPNFSSDGASVRWTTRGTRVRWPLAGLTP